MLYFNFDMYIFFIILICKFIIFCKRVYVNKIEILKNI